MNRLPFRVRLSTAAALTAGGLLLSACGASEPVQVEAAVTADEAPAEAPQATEPTEPAEVAEAQPTPPVEPVEPEPAAIEETSTVEQPSPTEEPAPVEEATPVEEASPVEEATPVEEAAAPAVTVSLPDLDVVDLASQDTVNLASVAAPGPTLVWFWAPH